MLSHDNMFIHHLAVCSYPVLVPFQTCKGTDRRRVTALPIYNCGSRRQSVVSTMPQSLYPKEIGKYDPVYIAKFLEKSGKFLSFNKV